MSDSTTKTKTVLHNPELDAAIVFTDDGLIDLTNYEEEWRLLYEGDKMPEDYEVPAEDC